MEDIHQGKKQINFPNIQFLFERQSNQKPQLTNQRDNYINQSGFGQLEFFSLVSIIFIMAIIAFQTFDKQKKSYNNYFKSYQKEWNKGDEK